MWNDFKKFIARGNVLDLAIAVIMGAAFGTVVKTFTDGIIMPIVGMLTGGIDFSQKVVNLGSMPVTTAGEIEAAIAAKQPLIMYGQFINDIIYVSHSGGRDVFLGSICDQDYLRAWKRKRLQLRKKLCSPRSAIF